MVFEEIKAGTYEGKDATLGRCVGIKKIEDETPFEEKISAYSKRAFRITYRRGEPNEKKLKKCLITLVLN